MHLKLLLHYVHSSRPLEPSLPHWQLQIEEAGWELTFLQNVFCVTIHFVICIDSIFCTYMHAHKMEQTVAFIFQYLLH
jgi:hypothetical protein